MATAKSASTQGNLEVLKQYYENSMQMLATGLGYDEKKQLSQAKDYYEEGIKMIKEAKQLLFKPHEREQAQYFLDQIAKNERMFTDRLAFIEGVKNGTIKKPTTAIHHTNTTSTQNATTQNAVPQRPTGGILNSLWNFFGTNESHSNSTSSASSSSSRSQVSRSADSSPTASPRNTQTGDVFAQISSMPPKTSAPAASLSKSLEFKAPRAPPSKKPPVASATSSATTTTPASKININSVPEFKGVDKKLIDHILNEVIDSKPNVAWEDIAGLSDAKQTLHETIVLPSLRPDIFNGLRSPAKGILLFGPPGNGKTLIAKAVASQSKATFFSISASALVSKWHGEGEKLVKALFAAARYLQPSVIFIDEIDSILTSRSSNDHEASRRMKTEFLVQMDGVSNSSNERVLVMGATNLPQELDEAILRRFVKRVYIPLPDHESRKSLLLNLLKSQATLSKRDLDTVAGITEGYSGSDLRALCSEASMIPIRELGSQILNIQTSDVRPIEVRDFKEALKRVKPSVSMEALKELENWNKKFGSFQK